MVELFQMFNSRQLRRRFNLGRVRTRTWASLAMFLFIGIAAVVLFVVFLFAWYAKDLPRPDTVRRTNGLSTVILDRNGQTLYDIYQNQNRLPAKFADIPLYLKEGTIAVEDKNFYTHQGLSIVGIGRAMLSIMTLRGIEGGSTLTQQLVKNVLLTNERTIPRKIKEAILAIQIERKYTKDEILQMYLNEAPYGGTAVGVESASQYYFEKTVKDLNLVESAVLAGLPQSPSAYSPFTGQPKAYVWRTQQVLRRMREDGYITPALEADANKQLESVKFAQESGALRAPHFVAFVKDQLVEKFGSQLVEGGGLQVTTTLDWLLQDKAQQIVKEEVDKAKYLKVSNGAAVVINPKTGEILAMVGSKDYSATDSSGFKFNVVVQGLRQPGSSIKPFTYATAFKKGYTASTILMDVDTKYPSGDPTKPEYNPKNYDGKFRGPMQLRYALDNSINTIAVKVSAMVGIKDALQTAYDMGISSLEPTADNLKRLGLSMTLGGGEVTLLDLTSAYGVFANSGQRVPAVSILKVVDPNGKVLYQYTPVTPQQVLATDVSYMISDILSDNNARQAEFGLHSYLYVPGYTVAAKTGTTDDKRDNWTEGYTPSVVIGAWVGNNDNSPMNQALASGITGAAPIWNRLMQAVLSGKKDEPFTRPNNIVEMDIDAYGGGLPAPGQPTRKERYIKGTEPTGLAAIYQNFKISRHDSNKLANSVEITRGDYDTKQYIVFTEADPISTDGKNRWQQAIDAWVATQGDSKFHPPKDTYQGSDTIAVSIRQPGDMQQVGNDVSVRVEASSTNRVTKVQLFVDDNKVDERSDASFLISIHIDNGSHILRAVATDDKGNNADTSIHLGVNAPYATPTPTPQPTSSPTFTPTASPTP
jgi:1A family penicillin-binding protein